MFWFGLFITLVAGMVVLSVCDHLRLSQTKTSFAVLPVMAAVALSMIVLSSSGEEAKPKTPAELHQERIESQFSAWDGSQRKLVEAVKASMNDPGSFEHVETQFADQGDHVFIRMTFRGTNAFGGKVVNRVAAKADLDGNIIELEQKTP